MQTLTIELIDDQAIKLLQQLEKINWLRILKTTVKTAKPHIKLGGTIPKNIALGMHEQLKEIRETWERDI